MPEWSRWRSQSELVYGMCDSRLLPVGIGLEKRVDPPWLEYDQRSNLPAQQDTRPMPCTDSLVSFPILNELRAVRILLSGWIFLQQLFCLFTNLPGQISRLVDFLDRSPTPESLLRRRLDKTDDHLAVLFNAEGRVRLNEGTVRTGS